MVPRLRDNGVELVALTFVDNAGTTRVKTVPLHRLAAAAAHGVGASPCFETFCFDDVMVRGHYLGGPDGDLRLVPDLARLVPLTSQPGWALAPADKFTQDGRRFVACQRAFAARQVAAAADRGLRLRMAFETEWALGRVAAGGDFAPAFDGPGYGMVRLEQVADYARELVGALTAQGLVVEQFHPEYALAQLEVSVAPNDPVGAADDVVLLRHTIRRLSAERGWRASFAPCIDPGGAGSGAHLHLSVQNDQGAALAGGAGLRSAGEREAAGIRRLPTSVGAAADALAESKVLAEAMGPELHDALVTVRRAESERFADADPAELVALTRWHW